MQMSINIQILHIQNLHIHTLGREGRLNFLSAMEMEMEVAIRRCGSPFHIWLRHSPFWKNAGKSWKFWCAILQPGLHKDCKSSWLPFFILGSPEEIRKKSEALRVQLLTPHSHVFIYDVNTSSPSRLPTFSCLLPVEQNHAHEQDRAYGQEGMYMVDQSTVHRGFMHTVFAMASKMLANKLVRPS